MNPHKQFAHQPLKLARLPIPPSRHLQDSISYTVLRITFVSIGSGRKLQNQKIKTKNRELKSKKPFLSTLEPKVFLHYKLTLFLS